MSTLEAVVFVQAMALGGCVYASAVCLWFRFVWCSGFLSVACLLSLVLRDRLTMATETPKLGTMSTVAVARHVAQVTYLPGLPFFLCISVSFSPASCTWRASAQQTSFLDLYTLVRGTFTAHSVF